MGGGVFTAGSLQRPLPPNPPAAKFTSQGDAPVRTDAQIKFLYYPLIYFIGPWLNIVSAVGGFHCFNI